MNASDTLSKKNFHWNDLKHSQYRAGLMILLIVAALIRAHQITQRGLWYWDEGIFIMGARFVRWRACQTGQLILSWFRVMETPAISTTFRGYPVFLQKPVHVILLAFFSAPFKNPVLSAECFSVSASLMTIVLTAELAKRWFNCLTGLSAALFLTLQPFHVHYSRTALHETSSMAIFLLMLVCLELSGNSGIYGIYGKYRKIMQFFAGFLAVAAIGASYRYVPYVFVVTVLELFRTGSNERVKKTVRRFARYGIGAFVCFTLINISYFVAFSPDFLMFESSSYIRVLQEKFLSSESSFDLEHPLYYLRMFFMFDGVYSTLLWITAIVVMMFHMKPGVVKTMSLVLAPLTLFSVTTTRVPRSVTGMYPFMAISSGWLVSWICTRPGSAASRSCRFGIAGLIVTLTSISMLLQLPLIREEKSGYKDVVEWLESTDDPRHFSTMFPIYAVYQGNDQVFPVPYSFDELHNAVMLTGIRYLTVDWQKFLRYQNSVYTIERQELPVIAFRHAPGEFTLSLYENHLPADVPYLRTDPTLGYIKIYDLHQVLPAMGYPLEFSGTGHE